MTKSTPISVNAGEREMQLRGVSRNIREGRHVTGKVEDRVRVAHIGSSGLQKGRVVKSRRWTPVGESLEPTPGR